LIEIRVPEEQEGTKAVVRAWLKQIGDAVAENDPLVELETDKVTQEVPAPAAGILSEILLDTDAEAIPGALLGRISTDGAPALERPLTRTCRRQRRRQRLRSRSREIETRLSPSVRPRVPATRHRSGPHQRNGSQRAHHA
jgi:2-oxoglutarate dehydrogenase E2 component (dihydrolipoamide succinyltransferase)